MLKPLYILMLCAISAASQSVEGTVVNSLTGAGIAGAKVAILQKDKTVYSATTDSLGHFRIEHVKEGVYSATFSAPEYWPEYWNGSSAAPHFEVTAGNPVKLGTRMAPLPHLSGRVLDGREKPVSNAQLEVVGTGGLRVLHTDGKGRFDHRFASPGSYTLAVVPPAGLKAPDLDPDSGRVLGWTRTYYPGVAIHEAAAKIAVLPGVELGDFELKLMAVPVHAVRGVLLDPSGKPLPNATVSLQDIGPLPRFNAQSGPDGAFELPRLVDGHWHLLAQVEHAGTTMRAEQWLEMAAHDIEDVKLQANPPFRVRGNVIIEKQEGIPVPKLSSLRVSISLSKWSTWNPVSARTNEDGTFTLNNVYPGTYQIEAESPPEFYLSAVQMGESRTPVQELELSNDAVPITILYKTNGGIVRGSAEKCGSGEVLLLPQDVVWRRLKKKTYSARCDSNDRYEIASVRPGDYYVLALTGSSPEGMPTPGQLVLAELNIGGFPPPYSAPFDTVLLNQASTVVVRTGETSSVDLRAFTRPLY